MKKALFQKGKRIRMKRVFQAFVFALVAGGLVVACGSGEEKFFCDAGRHYCRDSGGCCPSDKLYRCKSGPNKGDCYATDTPTTECNDFEKCD